VTISDETGSWTPTTASDTLPPDSEELLTLLEQWEQPAPGQVQASPEELCGQSRGLLGPLRTAIGRLRRLAPFLQAGERAELSQAPATSPPPQLQGFMFSHCLGRGAFGEVWLAHDLNLQAPRAVKLVPRHRLTDDAQAQLAEEARRMALLPKHRHRVQVHALYPGVTNSYLVMEYVDGGPLSEMASPECPLSWERAARYTAEVGDALAELHAAGLLHRDLKPANILWDRSRDEVLLADYGISACMGQTGIAGTAGFLAPELGSGLARPQSDVFALAATFFCLVTGRTPFPKDVVGNLALARAGLTRPVTALAGLPVAVQDLILDGLQPDPQQRPELPRFVAGLRSLHLQALAQRLDRLAQEGTGALNLQVSVAVARDEALDFQPIASITATCESAATPAPQLASLQTGDLVQIAATADKNGYLTVLSFGSSGRLQTVFPNPLAPDNETWAGRTRRLTLRLAPPAGTDRIAVVWTREARSTAANVWLHQLEAGQVPLNAPSLDLRDFDFVHADHAVVPDDAWIAALVTLNHREPDTGGSS
jgi:hypothetical protein